jgi:hypothetical protein
MNAITWIKGLAASIISAAATAVLASGISSSTGSPLNWHQIGSIAASAALVGASLYLKQSPIPDDIEDIPFSTPRNSVPQPSAPPQPVRSQDLQTK